MIKHIFKQYLKETAVIAFFYAQVDCPLGYHATLERKEMTKCTPCPIGFYQAEAGKTTCDSCPKGFTTGNAGSYTFSQCIGIWFEFFIPSKRTK